MMENKQQYQGLTSAQDYPDFVGSLAFVNGDCRCALLGT